MTVRKFLRTVPMKIYLLLAAIVIFSFFSNDFGLVDIQKTAIILAAGIDRTEEGFSVTAQIAVPKGTDRTTGGTSSVEIQAEGKTVSDCISNIYSKTGWVPKLVFCNLIVIGEEAAKEDIVSYLNYFIRNEYMPDSCLLAVCEGKAQELIASQSAIDDASSLAIEKLFSDAAVKSGKVMPNTLKDFAIGYYGVSESGYLPYVRAVSQQTAEESGSGGGGSGGSGGSGGGGSGSSGGDDKKIYSAEETAIFRKGKMAGLLPKEQTFAFGMLRGNVFSGTFNAVEKGEDTTLTVLTDDGGVSLEMKGAPKAMLSLDVRVRLCCRAVSSSVQQVGSEEVPEEVLRSAEEILRGYIEDLWNTCKEADCDLFNLRRSLYRSSLKRYAEWKDSLLETVKPEIKTAVRSIK